MTDSLFPIELKAVSETGEIEGYASTFGNRDLVGDIVQPGAFTKSLKGRAATDVLMLWGHDHRRLIGVWTDIAEDSIGLRVKGRIMTETRDGAEAFAFARAGAARSLYLTATPGNVVDYAFVEEAIAEMATKYLIQELAIDPAMSAGIVPRLQDVGLNVVHFRQGWISMTPAVKETERALLAGKVQHGGHPVLRWNFGNAVIDTGPMGDTARFSKAKSAEKIDGAVAAAMAIARAQASDTGPSIFESEWIEDIHFA